MITAHPEPLMIDLLMDWSTPLGVPALQAQLAYLT